MKFSTRGLKPEYFLKRTSTTHLKYEEGLEQYEEAEPLKSV